MRNKLFLTIFIALFLIGGLILERTINNTDTTSGSTTQVVSADGKTDGFASLSELEQGSPIIVRGTKTGKLKTNLYKSKVRNNIIGGYTETEFTISEVFKNQENNKKIAVNKKIIVGERAVADEGKIYTVNGYKEMEKGKEYLLFLVEEEGIFAPRAVTFGKIPLATTELEIYEDSIKEKEKKELFTTIFNDARKKYGK
jgi:hypothetical protein